MKLFRRRQLKKPVRISIATKLIFATFLLITAAAVPLAWQTSTYFGEVSQKKEEDINLGYAVARVADTENILQALIEKSRTLGQLYLANQSDAEKAESPVSTLMEADRDIFAIDILRLVDGDWKLEKSLVKSKQLQKLGADVTLMDRIRGKNPFPLASVAQGQIEIMPVVESADVSLMALGVPISRDEVGRINALTLTYFQLSRLQRAFSTKGARTVFLVDSRGNILAHPNEKKVLEQESFKKHPVVVDAMNDASPRKQLTFESDSGDSYRGAFVRTALGPIVISQVQDDYVMAPAREAKRQSIYLAGLILSGALFVVFIFSGSFTTPIETLAELLGEVKKGNLDVTARTQVRSRDEVGELAKAFDEMVVGLRERAKAYAVMRQALGASVVDTVMKMSETELGGQRKDVAVLFSDLRDFTKFSEGHSPEEVVQMLNEYFDIMVKVIEKHGGWLDKFIGDAIMAVWGVPYTGDQDCVRAAQAAIDMRLALQELNLQRFEKGLPPIKIGIGLHCGDAIVGKVGATERANLTVIGDTVNQASRIEASTKAFGTDILLSGSMYEQVKEHFVIEEAGQVEVKGKTEPLRLYRMRGFVDADGNEVEVVTQWSDYAAEAVDKVKIA